MAAWQEAQESLALAGHPRRRAETASEFAGRAAPAIPSSAPELSHLAGVTDAAGFSPHGLGADAVPPAQQAAVAVAQELRRQTGAFRRMKWSLDPRPALAGIRQLRRDRTTRPS